MRKCHRNSSASLLLLLLLDSFLALSPSFFPAASLPLLHQALSSQIVLSEGKAAGKRRGYRDRPGRQLETR